MQVITKEQMYKVGKALWELESHALLKSTGHSIDWDDQPDVIKNHFYKIIRTVLKELEIKL